AATQVTVGEVSVDRAVFTVDFARHFGQAGGRAGSGSAAGSAIAHAPVPQQQPESGPPVWSQPQAEIAVRRERSRGKPKAAARCSTGIPSIAVVRISFTPSGRFTSSGQVTRGEPGVVHSSTTRPVVRSKRTARPAGTGSGL